MPNDAWDVVACTELDVWSYGNLETLFENRSKLMAAGSVTLGISTEVIQLTNVLQSQRGKLPMTGYDHHRTMENKVLSIL